MSVFAAPSFDSNLSSQLQGGLFGGGETVYSPNSFGIDPNSSLEQNIYNMFSPDNNNSAIRNALKTVMIGVMVLYIARVGIDMMQNPNDEAKQKQARMSLIYIIFGAFLIRGAAWILGSALQLSTVQ